uniref:Uncharacterized protein n=1 Tax=Knipowitschia caucasica TaxID=637954 RepID=A0AAV2KR86_KNICA
MRSSTHRDKSTRDAFLCLFLFWDWVREGLLSVHRHRPTERGDRKDILEMLNIERVSASFQGKPHPYMRSLYQRLTSLQGQDPDRAEGTVAQSVRMSKDPDNSPHGWLWFNIPTVSPSTRAAELVLFRKTLHPLPLNVTVSLHSLRLPQDTPPQQREALQERLLSLDRMQLSGYDLWDVWDAVADGGEEVMGFQLRYRDEGGSLVLHHALTQSLYCVDPEALRGPILVLYGAHGSE